jgi:hypothetical protein
MSKEINTISCKFDTRLVLHRIKNVGIHDYSWSFWVQCLQIDHECFASKYLTVRTVTAFRLYRVHQNVQRNNPEERKSYNLFRDLRLVRQNWMSEKDAPCVGYGLSGRSWGIHGKCLLLFLIISLLIALIIDWNNFNQLNLKFWLGLIAPFLCYLIVVGLFENPTCTFLI